jgi:hypothetical protein
MTTDTPLDNALRFASELERLVYQQLLMVGWKAGDILIDPPLTADGRRYRPDFLLLYNLYPLAILEVKARELLSEDSEDRIIEYAIQEIAPFTLITSGNVIQQIDNRTLDITPHVKLPSPQLLWEALGRTWDESDPRLVPPLEIGGDIRPYHAAAISHVLDHLVAGNRRAIVTMALGTGRTYVLIEIIWKLLRSGRIHRTLVITDRTETANQIRDALVKSGFKDVLSLEQQPRSSESALVHLTTRDTFTALGIPELPADYYDFVVSADVHEVHLEAPLLDRFNAAIQLLFVYPNSRIFDLRPVFGPPLYKIAPTDLTTLWIETPPKGYYSVKLEAIAELRSGLTGVREYSIEAKPGTAATTWIITGRHLGADGSIMLDDLQPLDMAGVGDQQEFCSKYSLLPNDILLTSYWTGSESIKVALMPRGLPSCTLFANRLIRIRVTDPKIDPQDLYDFMRSDTWLLQLRQLATATGPTRFSLRDISQLSIYLPENKNAKPALDRLSAASQAIDQIRKIILPQLEEAERAPSEDTRQVARQNASSGLKALAVTLVGRTLEERVLTSYPMPIALAYRRLMDSRFNIYEQVLRLRDLFEAISFFIYNVVLADWLQRLDPAKYLVRDTGSRRAYNGFSMASRLGFVECVVNIASQASSADELFMPELAKTKFVDTGRKLQDEFRNKISHTATVTESQQRFLFGEFKPVVDSLLEDIGFIEHYRLVRVPAMYYKRRQFLRRLEVYQGTVAALEEEPMKDSGPMRADFAHIVLLDGDDDVLDLYPLLQLLASQETRFETHLCFLKQRKTKERRLEGESVNGAFEVALEGFEEFEYLQSRILDQPPADSGNKA